MFPAQLHSFRGTTIGDIHITFRVDQIYADDVVKYASKIGSEYMVLLTDVSGTPEVDEESTDPIRAKFNSKLHFLISDYSKLKEVDKDVIKDEVRSLMIEKKLIETSVAEADYKGLAIACNLLEELIKDHGTN